MSLTKTAAATLVKYRFGVWLDRSLYRGQNSILQKLREFMHACPPCEYLCHAILLSWRARRRRPRSSGIQFFHLSLFTRGDKRVRSMNTNSNMEDDLAIYSGSRRYERMQNLYCRTPHVLLGHYPLSCFSIHWHEPIHPRCCRCSPNYAKEGAGG